MNIRYKRVKPNLQALYKEKEENRLEKQAEIELASKFRDQAIKQLIQSIDKFRETSCYKEFNKEVKFITAQFRDKVNNANFKHLGKFDIACLWDNGIEEVRRLYNISKQH